MFSIYAIVCVKKFALTKQEESATWRASGKIIAEQLSAAGHLAMSIVHLGKQKPQPYRSGLSQSV